MLATIPSPPTNVIEVGPLTIHFYGVAIALGAVLAVLLARRRFRALGGDPDTVDRIAFWAVLWGLIGSRAAYVSTHLDSFAARPQAVLFVWEGGLAFFGGLLFGAVAALVLARRHRVPLAAFADSVIPGVPVAQALGRWGNYFNQELYGTPTDLPWGLEIEREPGPVHPTFLYESLYNLVLVVVLLRVGALRRLRQGSLAFVYMIGYGFGRFLLELLRTDTEFRFLGLSRNAWVALAVLTAGVVLLAWWQRHGPEQPTGTPIARPAATGAHADAQGMDPEATADRGDHDTGADAPQAPAGAADDGPVLDRGRDE